MDFVLLNDERDRPERATSWLEFLLAPARLGAYLDDLRAGRAHNPTAATLIRAFLDAAAAPLRAPLDPVAAAVRVVDSLRLPLAALAAALDPPVLWRLATAGAGFADSTTPDPGSTTPDAERALFWATLVPRVVVRTACDSDVDPALDSTGAGTGTDADGVVFRTALPADAPPAAAAAAELRAHIARTAARTDPAARAFRAAAAWELARLHVLQRDYAAARTLLESLCVENSASSSSETATSSMFEAVDAEACACLLALCRAVAGENTGRGSEDGEELALWRTAGAGDAAAIDARLVEDCVVRRLHAPARQALETWARLPGAVRARVAALNDVRAALDDPAAHCYGAGDGGVRARALADVLHAAETRGDAATAARIRVLMHEAQLFANETAEPEPEQEPIPTAKKARCESETDEAETDAVAAFINAGVWDATTAAAGAPPTACCALLARMMRAVSETETHTDREAELRAVVPALLGALVTEGWDDRVPPLSRVVRGDCLAALVSCAQATCCALQMAADTEDPGEWTRPVLAPPRYAAWTETLTTALLRTLEGDSSDVPAWDDAARAQLGRAAAHVLYHAVQRSAAAGTLDVAHGSDAARAAAFAVLGDAWYERGQCARAVRAYLQAHAVATRQFTVGADAGARGPAEDDLLRLASALMRADEHLAAVAVLQLLPRVDHRLGVRTLDRIPAGRLALHRDTSLLPCFFDMAFLEYIDCLFPLISCVHALTSLVLH